MDFNEFKEIEEYYKCERCDYECDQIISIKRHLKRKNKCKIKEGLNYLNEKELYEKSIIKKYKNTDAIKKKYEEFKKKESENNEENKKEIKCEYCFRIFTRKNNLEQHYDSCKVKSIIEGTNQELTNLTINNNSFNTTNIQNNIQNINYITLNLDKQSIDKMLIPFYDKFDTSHISNETQLDLLLCTLYEETLKEILKNNSNLNFYINQSKENNSLIYVENQKIDKVNNEVIYTEIWKKVKDYLLESLNELKIIKNKYNKNKFNNMIIETIEKEIIKKHSYLHSEDKMIFNAVRDIVKNCSEENKEQILNNLRIVDNELIENNI